MVKVFRAQGLAAADLGGKSDPFCVLELGNARLQTQTEYKTLSPSWQKIFTFNVKDINSVLEITVYDEDRDHKVEFLGKIAIPLLRIRNGEKKWYALKDKKLRSRAKGNSPQILLEMAVIWNPIRACIRTLNPREEKYMQTEIKFKRQVFVKNVLRMKSIIMHFYEFGKILQSCFEWESTFQSFVALVFWLIICYYFLPWMLPVVVLLMFFKQYMVRKLAGPHVVPWDEIADSDLDETTTTTRKSTFNFTVPYLSWIAVMLLVGASMVLYFIPIRYLLMLWGANKFFRRILRPHAVPKNQLFDLISRVPDDEMLILRKFHHSVIGVVLLLTLTNCDDSKTYDTNDWIPVAQPCKTCKDNENQEVPVVEKKAQGRVLNLAEPTPTNFFPDDGKQPRNYQPQFLRETTHLNPFQGQRVQHRRKPQHPYRFESPAQVNVHLEKQRIPQQNTEASQQFYVQQPKNQEFIRAPGFQGPQYFQPPQDYHTIPDEYLAQQGLVQQQTNLQFFPHNYQPTIPDLPPIRLNATAASIESINHELAESLKPTQQIDITSTTPKEEKESVQLLYVPLESLNQKHVSGELPRLHAYQQAPSPTIHQQFSGNYQPQFLNKQQQQIHDIQNDFVRQALEAHKLQLQLEQEPYALPVIETTTQTTTTTTTTTQAPTTTTKKPTQKKRKPHQPPLAVYMGGNENSDINDVLTLLKDAKSIEVQDSVGPDSPKIFVGPSTLDAPNGYAKFELPYLSSIDNNRVERKVDQLPFFVAPLSYKTPLGYSKIPLPSPHVGSVVVSTKEKLNAKDVVAPTETDYKQIQNHQSVEYSRPISSTPKYTSIQNQHVINQYEVDQINGFIPQYHQQQQPVQKVPEKYSFDTFDEDQITYSQPSATVITKEEIKEVNTEENKKQPTLNSQEQFNEEVLPENKYVYNTNQQTRNTHNIRQTTTAKSVEQYHHEVTPRPTKYSYEEAPQTRPSRTRSRPSTTVAPRDQYLDNEGDIYDVRSQHRNNVRTRPSTTAVPLYTPEPVPETKFSYTVPQKTPVDQLDSDYYVEVGNQNKYNYENERLKGTLPTKTYTPEIVSGPQENFRHEVISEPQNNFRQVVSQNSFGYDSPQKSGGRQEHVTIPSFTRDYERENKYAFENAAKSSKSPVPSPKPQEQYLQEVTQNSKFSYENPATKEALQPKIRPETIESSQEQYHHEVSNQNKYEYDEVHQNRGANKRIRPSTTVAPEEYVPETATERRPVQRRPTSSKKVNRYQDEKYNEDYSIRGSYKGRSSTAAPQVEYAEVSASTTPKRPVEENLYSPRPTQNTYSSNDEDKYTEPKYTVLEEFNSKKKTGPKYLPEPYHNEEIINGQRYILKQTSAENSEENYTIKQQPIYSPTQKPLIRQNQHILNQDMMDSIILRPQQESSNYVTGPQQIYQQHDIPLHKIRTQYQTSEESYDNDDVKTHNANIEHYSLPQDLSPTNQVLPSLINNLEDQSVRQLLNIGGLVPTSTKRTEVEHYHSNPVSSTYPPTTSTSTTTTTTTTTTTPAPTPTPTYPSTHLPVIDTTTTRRTRGRQRAGNRYSTTERNYVSSTRRTSNRGRRPLPPRTRYQDEAHSTTEHSPRSTPDPTKRVVTARSRFRSRGRPAQTEAPTTAPAPVTNRPSTTERRYYNDVHVTSSDQPQAAQEPTGRAVDEHVTPKLQSIEDQYVISNYQPVYNVPSEHSNILPVSQKVINVEISRPATEPVIIHEINQLPIRNLEEYHDTTTDRSSVRTRPRIRSRPRPSTTAAPLTEAPRKRPEVTEEKDDGEEFFGFFRPPNFKKPEVNVEIENPPPQPQRPTYSSTYVSSTLRPIIKYADEPISHNIKYIEDTEIGSSTPVHFVGEIRPKYQPTSTAQYFEVTQPSLATERHYQTTAREVDDSSKVRIRGRVRVPGRRIQEETNLKNNNELTLREETSARIPQRGRVRGNTHFKAPKPKGSAEDEDVEGGNYPPQFKAVQTHSSTPRPSFQITVDPNLEEDQETYSSIYRATYIAKQASAKDQAQWSPSVLQNFNHLPSEVKVESQEIIEPEIITAKNSEVLEEFPSEEKLEVEEIKTEEEVTTETMVETTTKKARRRGVWKLVKRPIDVLEGAESQNIANINLNSFEKEEKVKFDGKLSSVEVKGEEADVVTTTELPVEEDIATTPPVSQTEEGFFKSLYEMFGIPNEGKDKEVEATTDRKSEETTTAFVEVETKTEEIYKAGTEEVNTTETEEVYKTDREEVDKTYPEEVSKTDIEEEINKTDIEEEVAEDNTEKPVVTEKAKIEENEEQYQTTTEVPTTQQSKVVVEEKIVTTPPPMSYITPMSLETWTSTSTEISHETEICYKGKCIKSKDMKVPLL